MQFAITIDYAEMNALQTALRGLPARIEKNVLRAAGRKGAKAEADAIRARTPVSKRQTKHSKLPHLRDTVTVKQRTYRKKRNASVTYFAVGWGSPMKPHAHLVEDGTAQRFTGSKSEYQNLESKKIKTKKGWVFKRKRKSLGSKAVAGAVRQNRGIMPAFRPTHKAYSATAESVKQIMIAEIRRKTAAELKAASKRQRKTFGGIGL